MFKTVIVIISLIWASLLLISWSASSETAALPPSQPNGATAFR